MAQQNLYQYNPNDFRVGPLAYNGAITSINSGVVLQCSHSTKMYSCEYCTKPFIRKDHLSHHKREVHEWELWFECEKCEKKFKRKQHLDWHKQACCCCQRCHIQFKSSIQPEAVIITLVCGHVCFCLGCYNAYEEGANRRCPICRERALCFFRIFVFSGLKFYLCFFFYARFTKKINTLKKNLAVKVISYLTRNQTYQSRF